MTLLSAMWALPTIDPIGCPGNGTLEPSLETVQTLETTAIKASGSLDITLAMFERNEETGRDERSRGAPYAISCGGGKVQWQDLKIKK